MISVTSLVCSNAPTEWKKDRCSVEQSEQLVEPHPLAAAGGANDDRWLSHRFHRLNWRRTSRLAFPRLSTDFHLKRFINDALICGLSSRSPASVSRSFAHLLSLNDCRQLRGTTVQDHTHTSLSSLRLVRLPFRPSIELEAAACPGLRITCVACIFDSPPLRADIGRSGYLAGLTALGLFYRGIIC